jgi:hypothetical protein
MEHSWDTLTRLTGGKRCVVTSVRVPQDDIAIQGTFALPPLAELTMDEQLFVAAFIKTHGSIKQMESVFGISYPTVKNRLNAIASKLDIMDVSVTVSNPVSSILDRLEQGDIDVAQALKEIK